MTTGASGTIELDGAEGEGGGQVLRTSLALAMVTGRGFVLSRVRANRAKPGLQRQHLTCVHAAAEVCGALVEGDTIGSDRVVFEPGPPVAGDYRFAIGTAGATGLVLQTVLPPLWLADAPSSIVVEGGTHNSMAPSFHFLERVFGPLVGLHLTLQSWGFYPAGGGRVEARVRPGRPVIELVERGPITALQAHVAVSRLPLALGQEALRRVGQALGLGPAALHLHEVPRPVGPGFVVWIEAAFPGGAEIVTAFGERRVNPAEVADAAIAEIQAWRALDVPVGEHLADQLLLPLALFGGRFRTGPLSEHTRTNLAVIERFLPGRLVVEGGIVRGVG